MYNCDLTELTCILQAMSRYLENEKKNIIGSIIDYTCEGYKTVNRYLRWGKSGNASVNTEAANLLHDICLVFFLLPSYSPPEGMYLKLHRGMKDTEKLLKFSTNAAFLSTTSEFLRAEYFSLLDRSNNSTTSDIAEIILLPGYAYKILPVEAISGSPYEWEVILPPNMGQLIKVGNVVKDETTDAHIQRYVYLPLPIISDDAPDYEKILKDLTAITLTTEENQQLNCIISTVRGRDLQNVKKQAKVSTSPEACAHRIIEEFACNMSQSLECASDQTPETCIKTWQDLGANEKEVHTGLLKMFKDKSHNPLDILRDHIQFINSQAHPNA